MLEQIKHELNTLQFKLNNKDEVGTKDSADKVKAQLSKITVDASLTESEQERKEAERALRNTIETVSLVCETAKCLEDNFETRERKTAELEKVDSSEKAELKSDIVKLEKEIAQLWLDMGGDFVILESNMSKLETLRHTLNLVEHTEQTVKTSPLSSMNLI